MTKKTAPAVATQTVTPAPKEAWGTTANGMDTLTTSGSALTDLFFVFGAARNMPATDLIKMFEAAYKADKQNTLRMLFWVRDIRGGAGERKTFRTILKYLADNAAPGSEYENDLEVISQHVVDYGRWDDLYSLFGNKQTRQFALHQFEIGLNAGNGLCAKWVKLESPEAKAIAKHLGLTPRQFRKKIVALRTVVESQMCAKDWTHINYSHVPSVASNRYQKAFSKHDAAGYTAYRDSLKKNDGSVKINASAIFPHEIVRNIRNRQGDMDVAAAQWEALPDYLDPDAGSILPMCDVSGSMETLVGGKTSAMDVSIALGLYLAEKQKGPFKDIVLNFSTEAEILHLKGDILKKCKQLETSAWGGSTNVEAAFQTILDVAKKGKVSQTAMPKYLMILSDMEFNQATSPHYSRQRNKSRVGAMDSVRSKYKDAGYDMPRVIFWNLNGRAGNNPVTVSEDGTALVSGFSPAILKSILKVKFAMTPQSIMMETLSDPRYAGLTFP